MREFRALRILCTLGWLFINGSAFLSGISVVRLLGTLRILCVLGCLFKNGSAFISATSVALVLRLLEFKALRILRALGWLLKN